MTTPVRAPVEEAEHVAAILRLRTALLFGMVAWFGAVGLDVLNASTIAPGSLPRLLALRGAGLVVGVLMRLRLRSGRRISKGELRFVGVGTFAVASALISAIAMLTGGIESPSFSGVLVVLIVFGAVASSTWRRGALDAAAPVLAYPAVVLAAAAFSPSVATQLRGTLTRAVFFENIANLLLAYGVVVASGHAAWALRRQVFESRNLGRYKLLRRIGAGGMGEVWLAHHAALKRDVAIKVLRADAGGDASEAVTRFEREVHATTQLAHPNTVRIFDYGASDDGLRYYAMELLEGENVADLVARAGALPPSRAIRLATQAARALGEAHALGIVHRDVKPENLFVAVAGGEIDFIKVLDFGIAKLRPQYGEEKLTSTGTVVGTPAWLAPETIRGDAIDAAADVYALGAVLYLMLAGRPPFEGASAMAVVSAHLGERPVSPSEKKGSALPADLEAVVLRCLEKDPAARYRSARELADALDRCEDAYRATLTLPGARPAPP